jgi:putative membrane protein
VASDDRRLHPLSWVFTAAQFAKGFIVPALVLLVASGGGSYELWGTLFIGPVIAAALVQYRVYRYRLSTDEMVVRDGILTRTERHIPYERIQNIDLVQNPLHRLCRVALVRVETASGTRPEAVMRVLSLDAVAEMHARVFAGRGAAPDAIATDAAGGVGARPGGPAPSVATDGPAGGREPPPAGAGEPGGRVPLPEAWQQSRRGGGAAGERHGRVLLRVPTGELVKLGVISNKGMVVVAAALGLLAQSRPDGDFLEPVLRTAAERLPLGAAAEWLTGLRTASPVMTGVLLAVTVVAAAFVLLRVLSVAWFLLQLHGFTLTRRGSDLRADYGLLTRIRRTIPTARIQSLTATESPLHRRFRRQSLELRTVGGGASTGDDVDFDPSSDGGRAESQWLAPMVETAQVPVLLRQVLPEVDLAGVAWRRLAAGARWRILVRGLAVAAAVTLLATLPAGAWGLALAPPAALAALLHAHRWAAHAAWAVTAWGVLFRSGWWTRRLAIVPLARIQTVGVAESPFDRRHRMASVRIDTAGGAAAGYTIAIPYLEKAVAADVARRLYAEAGERLFRW